MASKVDFMRTCDLARAKFMKYREGPNPSDAFERPRWTMCNAHMMFVESFVNIYNRAEKIAPSQEQDFAFYCYMAADVIHHHHSFEEDIFFPRMKPEVDIDVAGDHASFTAGLNAFEGYFRAVLGMPPREDHGHGHGKPTQAPAPQPARPIEKAAYDGTKIKRLLEDLCEPFFDHLMREIDWLDPAALRASGLTAEKLLAIEHEVDESVKASMDPFTSLVFAIYHVPAGHAFPPVPFFLKKLLIPWVFYWKYRKSWKFLPVLTN